MGRILAVGLLGAVLALAALAAPVDRGVVENGADWNVDAGATGGGVVLVTGQAQTRLRPATCSGGTCTRVVPDAGAEGMLIGDIQSWTLDVAAPGDQSLTGTGVCELYRRNPVTGKWAWVPDKDKTITKTVPSQGFAVEVNDFGPNDWRIIYRCVGVGVSGNDGGSLTVSLQGCRSGKVGGCAP